MLLSHSKKFIFIHNYKVAGSSISDVLCKYTDDVRQPNRLERTMMTFKVLPRHYPAQFPWHLTAEQLRARLKGTNIFDSYYKFGLVRDPWDWQISLYTFMLKTPTHKQHRFIKKLKNFESYIDWRVHEDLHLQKTAFYDNEGNSLMDFIGKIENIEMDFKVVCKQLGIHETVPHINKSRAERSITEFYNESLIDIVNQAYAEDITVFKYTRPII